MSQFNSHVLSKTDKVLVTSFAFNEGIKIRTTVERIAAATSHDVLVMDDGSTDGSIEALRKFPIQIVSNVRNEGIGSAMKRAFDYALEHNYDIIVIMAGNNKDDPEEIPRLLKPIIEDHCDFAQGSRFLPGRWPRQYAFLPPMRDSTPSASVFAGCTQMGNRKHQRLPRI